MCGIAGGFVTEGKVAHAIAAVKHRGPDMQAIDREGDAVFGFARLAIVDPQPRSDQPFRRKDLVMVFNGEIWNFREMRKYLQQLGEEFITEGDTEVMAAAIERCGTELFNHLQGMWAVAWTRDGGRYICASRDRFGECPLHFAMHPFMFCSERKGLIAGGVEPNRIIDLEPGELISASTDGRWTQRKWYDGVARTGDGYRSKPINTTAELAKRLQNGCVERSYADVPQCALLSGGIDSTACALFLKDLIPGLVGVTAVYDDSSQDLRRAREAAEFLSMPLIEVKVPTPSADDLAHVVQEIEMPHKAQVEIGWACLKLAEAMKAEGFRVTYSGEGSDELWGSYGMSYHGIEKLGWFEYRRRLFYDQHRKNFMRCNKVFMARSVECRLPFLHAPLVEAALMLSQEWCTQGTKDNKHALKVAFEGLLPASIVKRSKVAFQDGLGLKDAIAVHFDDPRRMYAREYERCYGKG